MRTDSIRERVPVAAARQQVSRGPADQFYRRLDASSRSSFTVPVTLSAPPLSDAVATFVLIKSNCPPSTSSAGLANPRGVAALIA